MNNKNFGFTLAEVLITLGIIGVVAALTLPTLVQNYKVKTTVTKLKKAQSVLSQAVLSARNDYGETNTWGFEKDTKESVENIAQKIKPYLKLLDDCGTGTCEGYTKDWTFLNGGTDCFVENSNVNNFHSEIFYKLRLADGTEVFIRSGASEICFIIDVNGKKEPNRLGEDIFNFDAFPSGYFGPKRSIDYQTQNKAWAKCDLQHEGWLCTEWVLQNENMDYLKK